MAVFEQGLTDTLSKPAMRLAVQDHRIDGTADIVDRGVTDDPDRTGFGVDLDLADLCPLREARDRRQVGARCRRRGDLEQPDLTIGAGDAEPGLRELDLAILRPLAMISSVA